MESTSSFIYFCMWFVCALRGKLELFSRFNRRMTPYCKGQSSQGFVFATVLWFRCAKRQRVRILRAVRHNYTVPFNSDIPTLGLLTQTYSTYTVPFNRIFMVSGHFLSSSGSGVHCMSGLCYNRPRAATVQQCSLCLCLHLSPVSAYLVYHPVHWLLNTCPLLFLSYGLLPVQFPRMFKPWCLTNSWSVVDCVGTILLDCSLIFWSSPVPVCLSLL